MLYDHRNKIKKENIHIFFFGVFPSSLNVMFALLLLIFISFFFIILFYIFAEKQNPKNKLNLCSLDDDTVFIVGFMRIAA